MDKIILGDMYIKVYHGLLLRQTNKQNISQRKILNLFTHAKQYRSQTILSKQEGSSKQLN